MRFQKDDSLAVCCKIGHMFTSGFVRLCEHNDNVKAFEVVRLQIYRKQNLEWDVVTSQKIHRFVICVEIIDNNCDVSSSFEWLPGVT